MSWDESSFITSAGTLCHYQHPVLRPYLWNKQCWHLNVAVFAQCTPLTHFWHPGSPATCISPKVWRNINITTSGKLNFFGTFSCVLTWIGSMVRFRRSMSLSIPNNGILDSSNKAPTKDISVTGYGPRCLVRCTFSLDLCQADCIAVPWFALLSRQSTSRIMKSQISLTRPYRFMPGHSEYRYITTSPLMKKLMVNKVPKPAS